MAGLRAIVRALAWAIRRDLRSYQSITGNNFFLFAALLFAKQPESAGFFLLVLGFLLLFPLSADPLAKIPPERLALWPLTPRQRLGLRLCSVALSPVLWMVLAILLIKAQFTLALLFAAVAVAIQSLTLLANQAVRRAPQWNLLRGLPTLPGWFGGMVRNNVRQMLTVLDTYTALLLSVAGASYRFLSREPNADAFPMLALVVALILSTYAQCLFGLDGKPGITRYRLLPLRGWQVLLAKDVAYLALLAVLVLPLDPLAGVTSGMAALAVGHHASVWKPVTQRRWRFTGGIVFPVGLLQVFLGTGLGIAAHRHGVLYFGIAAVLFAISLTAYGMVWDRWNQSL